MNGHSSVKANCSQSHSWNDPPHPFRRKKMKDPVLQPMLEVCETLRPRHPFGSRCKPSDPGCAPPSTKTRSTSHRPPNAPLVRFRSMTFQSPKSKRRRRSANSQTITHLALLYPISQTLQSCRRAQPSA